MTVVGAILSAVPVHLITLLTVSLGPLPPDDELRAAHVASLVPALTPNVLTCADVTPSLSSGFVASTTWVAVHVAVALFDVVVTGTGPAE